LVLAVLVRQIPMELMALPVQIQLFHILLEQLQQTVADVVLLGIWPVDQEEQVVVVPFLEL